MNKNRNAFLNFLIATTFVLPSFCTAQTVTLFSHGIADKWKQINQYLRSYVNHDELHYNQNYLINTSYVTFNYPDASDRFYRVNYNETSFGQENEIARLYKAYQKTNERFNDCGIILFGLSRGASNLCIFAGRYQLNNVKAMVLESPYCSMSEVIESIMKKKNLNTWLPLSYGETVAEFIFKKYNRYGYSPANCIPNISKNIPIFIICSEEDNLVPCSSSVNVYKKLVESGNKDVYIFITKKGKHASILQGPEGEQYQYVLNAFYKKYNLPYLAADAEKGAQLLELCQPIFP